MTQHVTVDYDATFVIDGAKLYRAQATAAQDRVVPLTLLVLTTTSLHHHLHVIDVQMEQVCAGAGNFPLLYNVVLHGGQWHIHVPTLSIDL